MKFAAVDLEILDLGTFDRSFVNFQALSLHPSFSPRA
jgi:hypothetical protein